MPRDREHLALQQWQTPVSRRKSGGRGSIVRNHNEHGQGLIQEADELVDRFKERRNLAPQGINPKFIFKLQINNKGNFDIEDLEKLGLKFLGRDENKVFVVFPNDETLSDLRSRLNAYISGERKYHDLTNIEGLFEIKPEDRVGKRLRITPFLEDEESNVDIELWYNTKRECRQKIDEISEYLRLRGLKVTDWWIGTSICLIRAKVNFAALSEILSFDYIKEIDRRPAPSFEMLDIVQLGVDQIQVMENLSDNAPGILIVDSGIMQGHPLLRFIIGDAQVFPDKLREKIQGGPEDGDELSKGHGTAVAGIAGYGDVGRCIEQRVFPPVVRIFSARVTDQNNEYDPDELVEHQLSDALKYFLDNYPSIKVVNISLGDDTSVYQDGFYQFRFAAVIDDLAYQYRDKNVLFVVASGNYVPDDINGEEVVTNYPSYLINSDQARIIDPATSALALTVGGVSNGSGRGIDFNQENDTQKLVAQNRGWPSPFTRVGWGVNGAIKPELVDFAGDWILSRDGKLNNRYGTQARIAGVPTTAKDFALGGNLFRTVSGTSFAAPRVSNLAAKLFNEFPNASSNLIRALIVNSAQVPDSRPPILNGLGISEDDILRLYGYGQPSYDLARWSQQNDVCLLDDDILEIGYFRIYEIPSLPMFYLSTTGEKTISVTLAFDPITRHTRGDSYLGTTMSFYLYKNISPSNLEEAFRANTEEERKKKIKLPGLLDIKKDCIDLKPGGDRLKKGTVQKGVYTFSEGGKWKYNAEPIYLVITSSRKWTQEEITHQRYAVVVSIKHENDNIDLYSTIRQNARVYQQARLKLNV